MLVFGLLLSISMPAQDTLRLEPTDSLDQVAQITPYYSQSVRTSPYYLKVIDDPKILNLSAQVSIFNVLRGRIPNQPQYPAMYNAEKLAIRNWVDKNGYSTAAFLVDGVRMDGDVERFYNLNAFEFSSISVMSSPSSLAIMNTSNAGVYSLVSQSGEGITSPLWQVNSYFNRQVSEDWWGMTNALAFSQDFGAVDLRLSYSMPRPVSELPDGYTFSRHILKLNVGVSLNPKLSMRIITSGSHFSLSYYNSKIVEQALTGNAVIVYKPAKWLTVTGQVAHLSNEKEEERYVFDSTGNAVWSKWNLEQLDQRDLFSLHLRAQRQMYPGGKLEAFAGAQTQSRIYWLKVNPPDGIYRPERHDSLPSVNAGLNFSHNDLFTIGGTYTLTDHGGYYWYGEWEASKAIHASVQLSRLYHWRFLPWSRFRVNYGTFKVAELNDEPHTVWNLETGVDLEWFESRLGLRLTYFNNRDEGARDSFGRHVTILRNGWEAEVFYNSTGIQGVKYTGGLVFSSSDNIVVNYNRPEIRYSVYNQVMWSRWFASCIIDAQRMNYKFHPGSFIKVRDVSLGYEVSLPNRKGLHPDKVLLSVSGRNIASLQEAGVEIDAFYDGAPTTFSYNLMVNF